jgi:hypothetical protein
VWMARCCRFLVQVARTTALRRDKGVLTISSYEDMLLLMTKLQSAKRKHRGE